MNLRCSSGSKDTPTCEMCDVLDVRSIWLIDSQPCQRKSKKKLTSPDLLSRHGNLRMKKVPELESCDRAYIRSTGTSLDL